MENAQLISGRLQPGTVSAVAANVLIFDDQLILETARRKLGGSTLPGIFFRQLWTENWLRLKKRVNFRKSENEDARAAYRQMNVREFEDINARQQWANWRTIPRNLSGCLPSVAVTAIDLCCGIGHSTEVLAHYLPEGSSVLGLEFNASFVERALARTFLHASGKKAAVSFRAQSVLESFRDAQDRLVPARSVDLVNCCGAVGCHFDATATGRLAAEIARVLRPGGIALIDSGAPGTSSDELERIFGRLGFRKTSTAKSCFLDLYTQVRLVKL